MGIFDFLKKDKKGEKVISERTEKPSPEQKIFAETALEVFSPTFDDFGFKKHRINIKKNSTNITFRKENQYIKISSSTYPTDYPYFYNIILGEGDSEDFFEYDWNSIALWILKFKTEPKTKASEYAFPFGESVKISLENANLELKKYGLTFLKGNLDLFRELRKEHNGQREPYKIHSPDENGHYKTTNDPVSVKQKKKYS